MKMTVLTSNIPAFKYLDVQEPDELAPPLFTKISPSINAANKAERAPRFSTSSYFAKAIATYYLPYPLGFKHSY